jgi:hypothetical protein
MKRDMDLIRQILLKIEEHPYDLDWVELELEGYSPREISYHVMLLAQASLIEADNLSTFGDPQWEAKSLTWQGHEFLEAAKDESRWNKAKKLVKEKGGGMIFEVLKTSLIELAKNAVLSGLKGD